MTNFIEDKMWKEYMESDEYREELRKNNSSLKMHKRKILSANEAREKLNKVIENDERELEEIMGKIEVAINRKQDYVYVSANIEQHTISKLQVLGYHISDIIKGDRPFDPDTIKISW
jgi:chromosome segregation ATPase